MKVLIVKISAIGDVVMALPMVEAARRLDPGAQITWLCGETVKPLVEALGTVDEVLALDERKLLAGTIRERTKVLVETWKRLGGRRFDLVVTAHGDRRYRLLALAARGGERRSFGFHGGRPWPVPGRYHGDEYARLIHDVDGPAAERIPLPRLSFGLRADLSAMLDPPRTTIVLVPGGAKNLLRDDALRRWPLPSYVEVARTLIDNDVRVVIAGAASDEWVRDAFARLPVVDVVGRTDLLQLAALFQRSNLVVTHDSGPMHLAVLADAPVLALFGPTRPAEKIVHSARHRVLWGGEGLPCRPCYDGRGYAANADNRCLRSITPTDVSRTALAMARSEPAAERPAVA